MMFCCKYSIANYKEKPQVSLKNGQKVVLEHLHAPTAPLNLNLNFRPSQNRVYYQAIQGCPSATGNSPLFWAPRNGIL
jgi:hypothetical protein